MEVKIEAIERHETCKKHILRLLLAFQVVSEDEAALLARMPVQVNVDLQVPHLVLLHNRLLRSVNCRLPIWIWI